MLAAWSEVRIVFLAISALDVIMDDHVAPGTWSRSRMHRAKSYQQKRSGAKTTIAFVDQAPEGAELTDYDRQHLALYLRLLDAAKEGAAWTEAVSILFGLDPNRDRDRARLVYDSHLARARWIADHGYQDLLKSEKN